ncbi:hypothetical protein X975_00181, partial [Stegodyphus mimosarum]
MTGKKSSRMRKWKAGVRSFLLFFHFIPELVMSPCLNQGARKSYTKVFSSSALLLRTTSTVSGLKKRTTGFRPNQNLNSLSLS